MFIPSPCLKTCFWEDAVKFKSTLMSVLAGATLLAGPALAVDLSYVSGSTGNDIEFLKQQFAVFEKATGNHVTLVPMPSSTTDQFGQYKLWLAAGSSDIDVYQTDVIWAPQLADQFLDLTDVAKDVAKSHFPSIIESQTVNGAAGNKDIYGFVFQGNAYEGLTCDALEWVNSSGGGQIVEADGTISVNNPKAAAALDRAKSWVGGISPAGVLAYGEEDSRGVWQVGNAVFMRNWPYAYALGNSADSKVKGKFDVVPLPAGSAMDKSAATLGGWNLAVSKYSKHPKEAIQLALFLASAETQKANALFASHLPTIMSLYDDADIAKAQPIIPNWKQIFLNAVPRPSAPTKVKYNEVSSLFWNAVHDTISGKGTGADNLEVLEAKLTTLKGAKW